MAVARPNVLARVGQAKTVLMGGLSPTDQIERAYADAKVEVPKAITEANALLTKAAPLSGALATHKLTLTVPAPVK